MASVPRVPRRANSRSAIDPTTSVLGDDSRSTPTTLSPSDRSALTIASPRCPELPVTRTLIPTSYQRRPRGPGDFQPN